MRNKQGFIIIIIKLNMELQKPKILILGGTNFMGKALIDQLSQLSCQLHLINRGRNYWSNEVYKQNPKVIHHYGDRRESRQMTKMILYVNNKLGITQSSPWKAVVDFSSFRWREIQSIAKSLQGRTQLYILISSDSLYNNSPFNGQAIKEQDFDIQTEYRKLKGKKKSDKYGYNKLKCEIYLKRTHKLPYIALRLPDVIGPYENTSRYWCTLQWIKRSDKYPLEINEKDQKNPLSFVFSEDVARQIVKLIQHSPDIQTNKSYNLCCNQKSTYKQFIQNMALRMSLEVTPVFKQLKGDEQSNGMFPSTYTCISNQLAKKTIGWQPTSLDEVIRRSNKFFMSEAQNYNQQKKEMFREFKRTVVDAD